jgi:ribosomal peptide maturation radical SAM protein 1
VRAGASDARRVAPQDGDGAPDVLLVSMPFGPLFNPSFGLSLLKAALTASRVSVAVRYFTIDFAEIIGEPSYTAIALNGETVARELAGEWVFSHGLFDQSRSDVERYVEEILVKRGAYPAKGKPVSPGLLNKILRARERALDFLEGCLEEIVRRPPRLVGFTSMFEQHIASLALARRLKEALPDTFILFGGANCESVMGAETLRQFRFVDAVVSGEGELIFPELARRVLAGQAISGLQGVRTRDRLDAEFESGRFPNAPAVQDLDQLPYPDFSDYFEQFRRSRFDENWTPGLFVETSRGCWWGERMHCTFCGLNGTSMAYRSKSPSRALEEMTWLSSRHPGCDLQMVDNILDMAYFKTLLPEIAERKLSFGLFIETKSNLKKEQVRVLRDAGVRQIQPGIESFSDAVLKLMRKGVTGLQNVQLLKWCKEFGVQPYWNVLWAFPDEPPEEYERMARLVPLMTHFTPPNGVYPLRMDRFSPNFFDARNMGFTDVKPLPSYPHVFRHMPQEAIGNLAYYFDFRYLRPQDPGTYVGPLLRALRRWRRVHASSDLFSVDTGDLLLVWDLRPGAHRTLTVLDGLDRLLYQSCDAVCDLGSLAARVDPANGRASAAPEVEKRLDALVSCGLMLRDGARYLALAVPLGNYSPPERVVQRFYDVVARLGRRTTGGVLVPVEAHRGESDARRIRRRARPGDAGVGSRRGRRATLTPRQFSVHANSDVIVR